MFPSTMLGKDDHLSRQEEEKGGKGSGVGGCELVKAACQKSCSHLLQQVLL